MPQKKCNQNCLECNLPKCIHDIYDQHAYVKNNFDKIRHSEYYQKHRDEILKKVSEYNSKHRTTETNHAYYLKHKEAIKEKNHRCYMQARDARLKAAKEYYQKHKEEICRKRKMKREAQKSGQQEVL